MHANKHQFGVAITLRAQRRLSVAGMGVKNPDSPPRLAIEASLWDLVYPPPNQPKSRSALVLSSINFDFSSTALATSRFLSHATCSLCPLQTAP
jgi:hypothetical protein